MRILTTSLFVLLLSACSTTKLHDHWQAENFSRNNLNNVLIVAVDSTRNRFLFETEMESAAKKHGINIVTSYDALGDAFPTKEKVEAYIENNNIDYVIATKLDSVNVEKDYVPPAIRTYYTGPYYSNYGHYYNGYNNTVTLTRSGYTDTKTTIMLVTTIYDAKTKKPVWVGRSSSFEPGSVSYLAAAIAKSTWKSISK